MQPFQYELKKKLGRDESTKTLGKEFEDVDHLHW